MKTIEILDAEGAVQNRILANEEFAQMHYPDCWRLAAEQPEDMPQPAAPRRLAPLAFRRRFTSDERAAIEWAAVDRSEQPVPERMQAARLRATLKDQEQADFIDLDDPDTATGVQLLEALGLVHGGRAAEILTAPVQPEEMP